MIYRFPRVIDRRASIRCAVLRPLYARALMVRGRQDSGRNNTNRPCEKERPPTVQKSPGPGPRDNNRPIENCKIHGECSNWFVGERNCFTAVLACIYFFPGLRIAFQPEILPRSHKTVEELFYFVEFFYLITAFFFFNFFLVTQNNWIKIKGIKW